MQYDVIVIGGGVIGCSIARELSRYAGKIALFEREEDVCEGTSKANSGIVHGGYDAAPGTWKAKMNVAGSKMMAALAKELDIDYKQNGSVVVAFSEDGIPHLKELLAQGVANGVEGLEILYGEDCQKLIPNLSDDVVALLNVPSGGIVCPFSLTYAMADNAAVNGVEFCFETEVTGIEKAEEGYVIATNRGTFTTRAVVNAAGVYSDVFHNMVSEKKIHITPRRGQYCLMDKVVGGLVKQTIFQLPTKLGKGVLVTPTAHGNLMIGPNAENLEDKEAVFTTAEGLEDIIRRASLSVKSLPTRQIITSFAGLRAHGDQHDFVLGEPEDAPYFFDAAAIESPGLSSAPAIGVYIAELAAEKLELAKKENFVAERHIAKAFHQMTSEERKAAIAENPAYGNIICRCETVTEAEIVDAIHRPVGAKSLDGIKRRTRTGMGRCQAGFCTPKVTEILRRELGLDYEEITKTGKGSEILDHRNKEVAGK
ncbi:MAG: NAD(P)/FAD-dependent oxidoreductase [Lachnospiraceae bacterium]|nr:NAD(P)/FAD-dependent oxidoreductase [Lachnospiraceae bacterium]